MKIGDLDIKYPIIQGGMAIRVSLSKLAGSVAREGGMGVIAGTGLGEEELKREIRAAKEISEGNGAIGINVMYAVSNFIELINIAIKEKIDFITFGAGFSRDIFDIGRKNNIPVIPIVSSVKLAKISEKLGAAAVVAEGGNAGGHLGTELDSWDIVKEIKEAVSIPVFGAGGIITPEDGRRMLELGADGIQMGSRFVATFESNVAEEYKQAYLELEKDDIVKIMSSAGLPANSIKGKFVEKVLEGNPDAPLECTNCLKKCSRKYCIRDRLIKGKEGDREEGILFAGTEAWRIDSIISVKEVFERFKKIFD